jgi:adenosine kinase
MQGYGSDLRQIALKLAAEPKRCGTRARVVVFTQGADSTIVASNGTVTEYPVDKLAPELLVDTNGEHSRGKEKGEGGGMRERIVLA